MANITEKNNLVFVDSLSLGDGYDWADIEVYYSKEKNRFFWIEGSGCSCSWLWEDVNSLADMCDGDRQSAARAVRSFAEDQRGRFHGDVAMAAEGVLKFKM